MKLLTKASIKPFYQDIILTFITEALVLLSFFFVYRLIAYNYGPLEVGEYSLVKKVIGLLQPLLLMGLAVGLPRYVAIAKNSNESASYLKVSVLIIVPLSILSFIIINSFGDFFSNVFFGSSQYVYLVFPLSLFLIGSTAHCFVYSYLRGRLFVKTFNFLEIFNLAVIPVSILLVLKGKDFGQIIAVTGIGNLLVSLIFLLPFVKQLIVPVKKEVIIKSLKELFHYSILRFLGGFIYAGFLSLPAIIVAHLVSIEDAGYWSASQSLLIAAGAVSGPLGLILLPKVSSMINRGRDKEIAKNINYLIGAIIQFSLFFCCQLIIFSETIIIHWLGPQFSPAIILMQLVFLSLPFYIFCAAIGSVLDACKTKPINLINSLSALMFFLIILVALIITRPFPVIVSVAVAFTAGMILLGILTYKAIREIYSGFSQDWRYFLTAVLINTVLVTVTMALKPLLVSRFYYILFFEIVIASAYIIWLKLLKVDWLENLIFSFKR